MPVSHDRVDRLRGRARGRDRRHPHRPARAHPDRAAAARRAGEAASSPRSRRSIAELAGTTAHELNQPLTSIIGYSELIQQARCRPTTRTSAPSASSCARPSAWPRSCARSARSRVRDQGLRRLDADPRSRQEHDRWLSARRDRRPKTQRARRAQRRSAARRQGRRRRARRRRACQADAAAARGGRCSARASRCRARARRSRCAKRSWSAPSPRRWRQLLPGPLPVPARRRSAHAGADVDDCRRAARRRRRRHAGGAAGDQALGAAAHAPARTR